MRPEIEKMLAEATVSPALRSYFKDGSFSIEEMKILGPEAAVFRSTRGHYPSNGGTAKWSQVRLWYKGQIQLQEDQYKFSWGADRWDLMVIGILSVTETLQDNKVTFKVELKAPDRFVDRFIYFTFEEKEVIPEKQLNEEDSVAFSALARSEEERVFKELLALWEKNSLRMSTPHGSVPYDQPRVVQRGIDAKHGRAFFVTREQIDHKNCRGSGAEPDKQIRFELHFIKHGDEKGRILAEEHEYESQGNHFITVSEVSATEISYHTQDGEKKLSI